MNDTSHDGTFEGKWYTHPPLRNALIGAAITGTSFVLTHYGLISPLLGIVLYAIAIPIGGYHWAREGLEELVTERVIGIEILMLAATVGSIVLGLWDEAAFLVVLFGAAEGTEELAYARTRSSIRSLLDLAPKVAHVRRNGEEATIPAEELKPGDIFIVKPGDGIPTDGIILQGRSSVNEAAVTGESIPVEKSEGVHVYAATLNQNGLLEVRATASFKDNTLAKIIHLVEEAQEEKSRTQQFIDRFGRVYSPLVLLTSVLMLIIPPLIGLPDGDFATRAVVLLVAAAPCALIMSTPVAVAAGIGVAGRRGILIKGGVHLESLGRIKAIAFDKTGTLTRGEPEVTDIVPMNTDEQRILQLAYSVETCSEHPLAQSIIQRAKESGVQCLAAVEGCALPGHGVMAKIEGSQVYVAEPELFAGFGHDVHRLPAIERFRREGKTVILVGTRELIYGIIAARDQGRPGSREVIDRLKAMGIAVAMLTGDNPVTAAAVARELGIEDVRADLHPEDKIQAVRELKAKYGFVAMVGDGINDAPALAEATVGIAMGAAGADAAIEAADVALMADDLGKVPIALICGKRLRMISGQNIVFSLIVLAILIPSALAGILSVAAAVLFHESSELIAVANGLRMAKSEV